MSTIAITGSGGLVGSALTQRLVGDGHAVVRLVRHPPRETSGEDPISECQWSTTDGVIDLEKIEAVDAVVNLAGESVAGGRWTKPRRRRIWESRTLGTRNLIESISQLDATPPVLINASAVGYYGDRGAERLTESSPAGSGFLSDVCVAWEREAAAAEKLGARLVMARFGVILSDGGGALEKMLTPFRLGLGGKLGSGEQFMPWVGLDDVVEFLVQATQNQSYSGPINVTAPEPATNSEFTRELGRALRRPTLFGVPAFALKAALGDMAQEMLLASTNAVPESLQQLNFRFQQPTLNGTLEDLV